VLGLEATRKMKIRNLIVYNVAKLIVKKIRKAYQDKYHRTISYRILAWDLIGNIFSTFNIHAIPRHENKQVDSLAVVEITFKPPEVPNLKYEVEMKYRPSIIDNVKH
jgi:hypothetical protein